jgi:hypothetical protein
VAHARRLINPSKINRFPNLTALRGPPARVRRSQCSGSPSDPASPRQPIPSGLQKRRLNMPAISMPAQNLLEMNATDFDIPIPAPKALTASATKCC